MTAELNPQSRLRFAPSPTGTLHVGGARTALFNWLLARRCGGKFILRIEDTDRERSTEESVQVILKGLHWLGLDWDEGPIFQSQRGGHYQAVIEQLIKLGHAYPCFCSEERLEQQRETARKTGQSFIYDGHCRNENPADAARRIEKGEPHAIRFKIGLEPTTEFDDLIGGRRVFENDKLGDFVIRRSDGSPIYQLSVVVDDHEMEITHVIRGDDHLSNTPRQILIFRAMGWDVPAYGHLPLIQGPDRTRLSKRHGATSILEFAREGILPEAMFNYLALLGWSLDEKTELMSREELTVHFSIGRINQSAAIFDYAKLRWMNGVYLRKMPLEKAADLAREHFRNAGTNESHLRDPWFRSIVALEIERSRTFEEMRANLDYFFAPSIESYEEKTAQKHFLVEGAENLLASLEEELAAAESFDAENLENLLRALAEKKGIAFGKIVHPLRLALTGKSVSPGIFDVLVGLGRARSLERLYQARQWIKKQHAGAGANHP